MSQRSVFVALPDFCQNDTRPREILKEAGFEVHENTSGRRIRRDEMFEALRDVDGVLAGLEPYNADLLTALPRLRCISRCGVGTDAIDLEASRRLNIAVVITPAEVIEPVAQMTIAMVLALARNLPLHLNDFRGGLWRKHTGYVISEWTIGLVGFGRIGRAVERYLRAFGPRVIVTDPNVKADQLPDGVSLYELLPLLAEADIVSLHAAMCAGKTPLIGYREIRAMKKGSRLVNTARGCLVDEGALCDAIESGHLAAAALDVFETEPYEGPLVNLPQVLCTPHVASLAKASRIAMEVRCARNVVEFFSKNILA